MNELNCPSKNPLQRDGTSRSGRLNAALDPSFARLHDFSPEDWMKFAFAFSKKLQFFSTKNEIIPSGDWSDFFISDDNIDTFIEQAENINFQSVPPHLALFYSFIKLLQPTQEQLNAFTRRHLDFYFRDILRLGSRPAVPDRVHIIFEPAKNTDSLVLPEGILLDAGKDKAGKPMAYKLSTETTVNKALVKSIKSVYHSAGRCLTYSEATNSREGTDSALNPGSSLWSAFGSPELPSALPGFSIASPVLFLEDGARTITLAFELDCPGHDFDTKVFKNFDFSGLIVQFTSGKGWINASGVDLMTETKASGVLLKIILTLDNQSKSITAYDPKIHKGSYATNLPVMRCLFNTASKSGYSAYLELSGTNLISIQAEVDVKGSKSLFIENDTGKLDAAKPFMPFGPAPKANSAFFIRCPSVFIKNWKDLKINIDWENVPNDLQKHYAAYRKEFLGGNFSVGGYTITVDSEGNINAGGTHAEVTGSEYFTTKPVFISDNQEYPLTGSSISLLGIKSVTLNPSPPASIPTISISDLVSNIANETDRHYVMNYLSGSKENTAFHPAAFDPGFPDYSNDSVSKKFADSFIRIALDKDFLHSFYPTLYTAAMILNSREIPALIPNMPYTPVISSISLDYHASVSENISLSPGNDARDKKLLSFRNRNIQFFTESPFGTAQQHIFLAEQEDFLSSPYKFGIVPAYPSEGELYIGLSGALPGSQTGILFQVAEGSENPSSPVFGIDESIQWSALCNNCWKSLNNENISEDDTGHFLRSGLIRFLLPIDLNSDNTLMPSGLSWLRARLPSGLKHDSVCLFTDVIAQAAEAEFCNHENELSHLDTCLPAGTITRITDRPSGIKSVSQPFHSFGGKPAENVQDFYTRVSERLRHKNRAVNLWDYERLVLEKFPSLHKVKCLNHTSGDFELDPGYVKIIPIPDLRNKNIYDIFQPRISRNLLNEIEQYLSGLNSKSVTCLAENPDYEEVTFSFRIKFKNKYDPCAYTKILNVDIRKFLSPWAYGETERIFFGGTLYKSQAITFIENLDYVDYITGFRMYKTLSGGDSDIICAENSSAILTSCKKHDITTDKTPACS